jgi:prevent-host-death family protein
MCYMDRVTHREMRNNSGEILRRVAAGETIEVTNNGRVAAHIIPPPKSILDELEEQGQLTRPTLPQSGLSQIKRVKLPVSTKEIIDDVRGRW